MIEAEALRVDRALRRIRRLMWLLGAVGGMACAYWKGWSWAAGYLAGSIAAILNFGWLDQVAVGLAHRGAQRRLRWAVLFGARYLLIGAAAYVIVNMFGFSALAILVGLLVAAIAVTMEMLYELVHGRT